MYNVLVFFEKINKSRISNATCKSLRNRMKLLMSFITFASCKRALTFNCFIPLTANQFDLAMGTI
jgi:hypothetical protein